MAISRLLTRTCLGVALICGGEAAFGACKGATAGAEPDASALVITPTSLDVTDDPRHRVVTSLGTIRNPSTACFDHLVIEVQYFDPSHVLVDTLTQPMDIVAPAGDEVSFRLRDDAARDRAAYASQTMRIVSADPRISHAAPQQPGVWMNLFLSWAPMLLLIGVWMIIVRHYQGRKSPAARSVELIERQTVAIEAQSRLLERIALAVEQRGPLR